MKMRQRLNRTIARETGQTYEKVVADTDRNFWMSAEEAIKYGLVSRIINHEKEV
jgi:ATP-dependent Clp protease protease subunit